MSPKANPPLSRGFLHGFAVISSIVNSLFREVRTRHSRSLSSTISVRIICAGRSPREPGSIVFRRTCPTPSVKIPLAGMILTFSPPTSFSRIFVCRSSPKPCGTLTVVHNLYSLPAVSESVDRTTTWPGKRVLPEHVIKCRVELFGGHFPGHERSLRKIRRQKRLADPSNRSRGQHRLDPVQDQLSSTPDNLAISLKVRGQIPGSGLPTQRGFWN